MADVEEFEDVQDDPEVVEDHPATDQDDAESEGGEAEEGLVWTFDGDEEAEQESVPIRDLRARNREMEKELNDLRYQAVARQKEEVGEKPKLDQFYEQDNPEEAYEAALDAWKDKKAAADAAQEQSQAATRQVQSEFQADVELAKEQAAKLPVRDFKEVVSELDTALSIEQKSALIIATENKAAVMYALSKNPKRLAELAKITNPIKFAVAVAKLETSMKSTPRKRAPEPEGIQRGSAPMSAGGDKARAKLEAEADKTGEYTKLLAYDAAKKAK